MSIKVLVIDDEDLFREDLASLLRRRGFECLTASNGEEGFSHCKDFLPDVVLCDLVMPGKGGLETVEEILKLQPDCGVMLITAHGTLETAVQAFRRGVSDYLVKPLLIEDVEQKIQRWVATKRLRRELSVLRREVSRLDEGRFMVGDSDPMKSVYELIAKVAPTRSTVLITGESGTGKELVARSIHKQSKSADLPLLALNCASIPENLLESELFGHVKGAFTGAEADKEGLFEIAGEGTLFLDEIAEMPISLQSKLLRVLEQREFGRVGGVQLTPLKARVIASTNKDLRSLIKGGLFREDLYFRVAVFEISLPPLRERRTDIPLLVEHFVKQFNPDLNRRCRGADSTSSARLLAYSWPGNVRELRNVIERAMILTQTEKIGICDLPPQIIGDGQVASGSDNLRETVRSFEGDLIRQVLRDCDGNRDDAARRLGINASTLYRKIADLGLVAEPQDDSSA